MRRAIGRLVCVAALSLPETVRAHPGVGIVADGRGNVYYTDLRHVWRIDAFGRRSIAVRDVHTHELFLDEHGHLFGEHLWYEGDRTGRWGHRVWRLAPDGTLTDVLPAREGFRRDYSFVRDRAGTMYWASDPRSTDESAGGTVVRKRTPDGGISAMAGGPSEQRDGRGPAAGFIEISWMAATPAGDVYLVDKDRLRHIAPDGAVRTLASGLLRRSLYSLIFGDRHQLMGLWPTSDGTVYLANPETKRLLRIKSPGQVEVFYESRLPWSPTGVTVSEPYVYVLEYASLDARPRRLTLDGREAPFPVPPEPSRLDSGTAGHQRWRRSSECRTGISPPQ